MQTYLWLRRNQDIDLMEVDIKLSANYKYKIIELSCIN